MLIIEQISESSSAMLKTQIAGHPPSHQVSGSIDSRVCIFNMVIWSGYHTLRNPDVEDWYDLGFVCLKLVLQKYFIHKLIVSLKLLSYNTSE